MPARIYTDRDANLTPLKKRRVAVIGFGSQGHAHALNLKNSGIKVTIGLYKGSKSIAVAKKHGFKVLPTAEAVRSADVIFVAVPDLKIPSVYEKDIAPNLRKGQCLLFSHGFAIHYKTVKPQRTWMSSSLLRKALATSCVVNIRKVAGSRPSLQSNKTPPAKHGRSPWHGPAGSVPHAQVFSKPPSKKRPRPTSSANKPFFAGYFRPHPSGIRGSSQSRLSTRSCLLRGST